MSDQADLKRRVQNVDSEQAFPLGELITALTKELRESNARAEQEAAEARKTHRSAPKSLQVNEATIELAMQFEWSGKGGLSFKVFGVGAEAGGGLSRANTTTMTLRLGPAEEDGPLRVARGSSRPAP